MELQTEHLALSTGAPIPTMLSDLQWLWGIGADERGWLLAIASGIACVLGSCIICLDIFTAWIPWCRNFNIRENRAFLAGSLSLSFGVMIFSSLYGILPEASSYMINGGKETKEAKLLSIVFFFVGVFALSALTELLHRILPSSIVVCGDHNHHPRHNHEHKGVEGPGEELSSSDEEYFHHPHDHHHHHHHDHDHHHHNHHPHSVNNDFRGYSHDSENYGGDQIHINQHQNHHQEANGEAPRFAKGTGFPTTTREALVNDETPLLHRQKPQQQPSLKARLTAKITDIVSSTINYCNEDGTCFGFSETRPCDRMCDGHLTKSKTLPLEANSASASVGSSIIEFSSAPHPVTTTNFRDLESQLPAPSQDDSSDEDSTRINLRRRKSVASIRSHASGHHHVPKNEFLNIGVQTSLAIALHKLPEGFITFATNHADPKLGFAVFLALAIHNISEGFAMSLPLFLALRSRVKAIIWASCLGGLSQPTGALLAWMWLTVKGIHDDKNDNSNKPSSPGSHDPNGFVYGVLFAVTAGIMCNVAVQLFAQSVGVYHKLKVPLVFAFLGMGIMGMSFGVSENL